MRAARDGLSSVRSAQGADQGAARWAFTLPQRLYIINDSGHRSPLAFSKSNAWQHLRSAILDKDWNVSSTATRGEYQSPTSEVSANINPDTWGLGLGLKVRHLC